MDRTENTELTTMCMISDGTKILVQDRNRQDWSGISFPGGHVEHGESFVAAVKREVKEETGLEIENPVLCGIKQWPNESGARYIVLFFKTNKFSGELRSSEEGRVFWIERDELTQYRLATDFLDMVRIMENPSLTEFYYSQDENGQWKKQIF